MIAHDLEETLRIVHEDARRRRLRSVTVEHLVLALLDNPAVRPLIQTNCPNEAGLRAALEDFIENRVPKAHNAAAVCPPSDGFQRVLQRALSRTPPPPSARRPVTGVSVLAEVFVERESFAAYFLQKHGLERPIIINHLARQPAQKPAAPTLPLGRITPPAGARDSEPREAREPREIREASPAASDLVNLTQRARDGNLEKPFGREAEMNEIMRAMCLRFKRNPMLVGEAGVGKTALVYGLAHRLAAGRAPRPLANMSALAASIPAMLSGTRYRGDFEQRVGEILARCRALPRAALFIDETHNLVGAGGASGGGVDAADIFLPALTANDGVTFIGATTPAGWRAIQRKNPALARRFQKIAVDEPRDDELMVILSGLARRLGKHHGAPYEDEAVEASASLARRFFPARALPDIAVDILDQAGAMRLLAQGKLSESSSNPITAADVESAVSAMTGQPPASVAKDQRQRLADLEAELGRRVFAQEAAVRALAQAVRRARFGLGDPARPEGAYLFAGPTGVGKTELARALADSLGRPLARFDMSEHMEAHSVSRLIGAPPGYVGFDKSGALTERIARQPNAVLLFDEVEKAHPEVLNILLQVMDYGALTDGAGARANFCQALIILTTNAGAEAWNSQPLGFAAADEDESRPKESAAGMGEVRRLFSPEFRNRLDAIIPFSPLPSAALQKIADFQLSALAKRVREQKGAHLRFDRALRQHIAAAGGGEMGARPIARAISDMILDPLAAAEIAGEFDKEAPHFTLTLNKATGALNLRRKAARRVARAAKPR